MSWANINNPSGFTLIELLVVIGIIAVLALVTIFTLNPAELLRQSRDYDRISDLNTIKTAISLYLADVSSPNLTGGTTARCYGSGSGPSSTASCQYVSPGNAVGGPFISGNVTTAQSSTNRAVSGGGWLPINFSSISSGAPFGALPQDPTNNTTYYYVYMPTSTSGGITFKLAVMMESTKYKASGTADAASTDGGTTSLWFESGTELTM